MSAFRRSLDQPIRAASSRMAAELLISAVDWRGVCRVSLYDAKASLGEVDTLFLASRMKQACPDVQIDIVGGTLSPPMPKSRYDLIIVPVVAFDEALHRIGMGGGWYDRFLASQPHARKAGLAYEQTKAPLIPAEAHDIPLDMIVTEHAVYSGPAL